MENKVSSSNPNIKNMTVKQASKPKTGKPVQRKVTEQPTEDSSPIELIRRSTLKHGKDTYSVNVSGDAQDGDASKEKEQIRIVIRDAKPPMAARALQAFMRLICVLLIIAVCGIGIPRLFGINEFNVLTGSMTPTYPVGTLVFVQPKDPSTIRPGEVVTCIMNEDLDMVTHRVTANNYEDKTITTKGDANNSEDSPSLYENVVGVVCFSVPYAGGVVDYLTNDTQGRIVGIGIVLAILALTFIAEAICYLLTKQSANVYNSKTGSKGYNMKSINARKFNRTYKRGKGTPIPSSQDVSKQENKPAAEKQAEEKPKDAA